MKKAYAFLCLSMVVSCFQVFAFSSGRSKEVQEYSLPEIVIDGMRIGGLDSLELIENPLDGSPLLIGHRTPNWHSIDEVLRHEEIFALDPETGNILWSFQILGESAGIGPQIFADKGKIYIALYIERYKSASDYGKQIVVFDQDGNEVSKFRLPSGHWFNVSTDFVNQGHQAFLLMRTKQSASQDKRKLLMLPNFKDAGEVTIKNSGSLNSATIVENRIWFEFKEANGMHSFHGSSIPSGELLYSVALNGDWHRPSRGWPGYYVEIDGIKHQVQYLVDDYWRILEVAFVNLIDGSVTRVDIPEGIEADFYVGVVGSDGNGPRILVLSKLGEDGGEAGFVYSINMETGELMGRFKPTGAGSLDFRLPGIQTGESVLALGTWDNGWNIGLINPVDGKLEESWDMRRFGDDRVDEALSERLQVGNKFIPFSWIRNTTRKNRELNSLIVTGDEYEIHKTKLPRSVNYDMIGSYAVDGNRRVVIQAMEADDVGGREWRWLNRIFVVTPNKDE